MVVEYVNLHSYGFMCLLIRKIEPIPVKRRMDYDSKTVVDNTIAINTLVVVLDYFQKVYVDINHN